ncbi:hypothetical protein [Rubripirellula obstinata]|nr:hypothetical protein [Rubripirellula obstinata]
MLVEERPAESARDSIQQHHSELMASGKRIVGSSNGTHFAFHLFDRRW